MEQLHKIFKIYGSPFEEYWRKSKLPHATIFKPQQPYIRSITKSFKAFPALALSLIETLLSIDPSNHGSAASTLKSEFFTTKPLPRDLSSLPKYLPSKEFDAKVRDAKGRRRQGAAGNKGHRQSQPNSKCRSEEYNPIQEEVASGFPIEPARPFQVVGESINFQGQTTIVVREGLSWIFVCYLVTVRQQVHEMNGSNLSGLSAFCDLCSSPRSRRLLEWGSSCFAKVNSRLESAVLLGHGLSFVGLWLWTTNAHLPDVLNQNRWVCCGRQSRFVCPAIE
ncbi:hypothetical protein Nepgr_022901 [Nepenthes gracilis]|uniref:Uncharacterized protein n=1 Tax=Nepenthes gracilis TaxID=150966 RepID=A0AAD3XYI8_NEPGR|nr:hypothetical protein Nepgr_022901 [Nepenthes gracilis]